MKFPKYFQNMEYTFTLTKVCVCVCTCVCALAHIKVKLIFLVNKTFLENKITHLASNIKIIFILFYICIISNPKKLFKDFFVQLFKLCNSITKMIQVTHSPKPLADASLLESSQH